VSAINRLPKGLQEFLGNTSQGVNPGELLQGVRPGVDLYPFWSLDQTVAETATQAVTSPGNGAFLTIPEGEVWAPLTLGARITGLTGNDDIRIAVSVFSPGGLEHVLNQSIDYNQPVATSPNSRYSVAHNFERTWLFPAGWIFGAVVQEIIIAAPSENMTISMITTKMRA